MFIHTSSSICHAFTTVVTPVAGTGCRKSCYPTFISTYQLRETAPETHIPKSRNLAELFRIQTYCSLSHIASPHPHHHGSPFPCLRHSALPEQTWSKIAERQQQYLVSKCTSGVERLWKRMPRGMAGRRQSLHPFQICQV